MDLSTSTIAFLLACALVGGYLWNSKRWGQVPQEELLAMLHGPDPTVWKASLRELQHRGTDTAPHVARLAALLLAPEPSRREAAWGALTDVFPEWQRDLAACGYRPDEDVDRSRDKLRLVFEHLRVQPLP